MGPNTSVAFLDCRAALRECYLYGLGPLEPMKSTFLHKEKSLGQPIALKPHLPRESACRRGKRRGTWHSGPGSLYDGGIRHYSPNGNF